MPSKRISIQSLKIGMYLCGIDRTWMDTPFLTHRFLIKSQNQIDKLIQCGVKELDIDPSRGLDVEESGNEKSFPETISGTDTSPHDIPVVPLDSQTPEERIAHLPPTLQGKPLTNELSSMKEVRQHMLEAVRGLLGNVRTSGVVEGQQVKEVAQHIISETLDHEDACVALIRTREFSTDLYDHSLSVGTLAVLLGRLVGFDEIQLRTLASAALLHDIGLLKLPKELTRTKGRLSESELQQYQSHPALGVEVLRESPGVPLEVLQVVAEHHVALDNSGFPTTISPEEMALSSRLIRLVDEYDELLTGQHRRFPLSIKDALRELYQQGQQQLLDARLVTQFINQVGIYPIYSMVELSTGERGIVTANSPGNLLQPTILLFQDANRKPFLEPVPINFSVIKSESTLPEIVRVLDPEQEGVRVEKVLADWVTF